MMTLMAAPPYGMNRHKMLSKWLWVEAPHDVASSSEEEQ